MRLIGHFTLFAVLSLTCECAGIRCGNRVCPKSRSNKKSLSFKSLPDYRLCRPIPARTRLRSRWPAETLLSTCVIRTPFFLQLRKTASVFPTAARLDDAATVWHDASTVRCGCRTTKYLQQKSSRKGSRLPVLDILLEETSF